MKEKKSERKKGREKYSSLFIDRWKVSSGAEFQTRREKAEEYFLSCLLATRISIMFCLVFQFVFGHDLSVIIIHRFRQRFQISFTSWVWFWICLMHSDTLLSYRICKPTDRDSGSMPILSILSAQRSCHFRRESSECILPGKVDEGLPLIVTNSLTFLLITFLLSSWINRHTRSYSG